MQRYKKHLFTKFGKLNLGRYDARGTFIGRATIVPAQSPLGASHTGKFDAQSYATLISTAGCVRATLADYIAGCARFDDPHYARREIASMRERLAAHGWSLP